MKNFISAETTNRRLCEEHATARDAAVEAVNKIITAAKSLPIAVPKSLFTDLDVVRCELLRKLEQESGWLVSAAPPGAEIPAKDDGHYYLNHRGHRPGGK